MTRSQSAGRYTPCKPILAPWRIIIHSLSKVSVWTGVFCQTQGYTVQAPYIKSLSGPWKLSCRLLARVPCCAQIFGLGPLTPQPRLRNLVWTARHPLLRGGAVSCYDCSNFPSWGLMTPHPRQNPSAPPLMPRHILLDGLSALHLLSGPTHGPNVAGALPKCCYIQWYHPGRLLQSPLCHGGLCPSECRRQPRKAKWKWPKENRKAVTSRLSTVRGTCPYPLYRSNVEMNLALPRRSTSQSTLGIGYGSNLEMGLSFQRSRQKHGLPSLLRTSRKGLLHLLAESLLAPICNKRFNSSFRAGRRRSGIWLAVSPLAPPSGSCGVQPGISAIPGLLASSLVPGL